MPARGELIDPQAPNCTNRHYEECLDVIHSPRRVSTPAQTKKVGTFAARDGILARCAAASAGVY